MRTEGQHRQSRQEHERPHHVELRGLGIAAISQDDAGPENGQRHVRQQLAHHVLAEFFRARIGIIIRALPLNRPVFHNNFVAALSRHRHRAYIRKPLQPVIVVCLPRQLHHFERPAQIHIQTTFFRLPVQRSRAVDNRIRGVHEPVIIASFQSELGRRKIAAKYPDLRLQILVELGKRQVQLQRLPKPHFGVSRVAAAHQQIHGGVMPLQQIRGDMRADVPGSTGQENCHVAPSVPVVITSPFSSVEVVVVAGGICNSRGARASSGRPSISGYVHRRNAGI